MKHILLSIILAVVIASMSGCASNVDPVTSEAVHARVYYIAAEEMIWNYAAADSNVFMGMPFDGQDSVFAVNIRSGETPRIGPKYWKARYVEYTDSTFTTRKSIAPEWEHLGMLGPVIRANEGDSVIVFFRNNTTE